MGSGGDAEKGKRRMLCRYALARSDFFGAMAACDLFLEREMQLDALGMALMDALVVGYARPFTQNRPLGPLGDSWKPRSGTSARQVHDDLIEMRHKSVAHTDWEFRTVSIVPVGTRPYGAREPMTSLTIGISNQRLTGWSVAAARQLCERQGMRANSEVIRLLDELYRSLPPGGPEFEIPISD